MKVWIGHILLYFAIFTLGFGLGKTRGAAHQPPDPALITGDKVLVYYLHTTIRCVDCNAIEEQARQVVLTQFADEVAAGEVEWRTANFQEREDLAERYGVIASTVVVVDIEDGDEKDFMRLDEVWVLMGEPEAFTACVATAIHAYLEDGR